MKDLIKGYLDNRISRRDLLSGLGTLGITAAAANSMAQSFAPFLPAAGEDGAANARLYDAVVLDVVVGKNADDRQHEQHHGRERHLDEGMGK